MLKYVDAKIVFSEVPDEITLAISISGCPGTCEGCHSPQLREDIGEELNPESLYTLIRSNEGISCVCFMGGDASLGKLDFLAAQIHSLFPELKVAWYSGLEEIPVKKIGLVNFDYIKIGPYKKAFGPLNSPSTNQRFYKVIHTPVPSTVLVDETHRFWKKDSSER